MDPVLEAQRAPAGRRAVRLDHDQPEPAEPGVRQKRIRDAVEQRAGELRCRLGKGGVERGCEAEQQDVALEPCQPEEGAQPLARRRAPRVGERRERRRAALVGAVELRSVTPVEQQPQARQLELEHDVERHGLDGRCRSRRHGVTVRSWVSRLCAPFDCTRTG